MAEHHDIPPAGEQIFAPKPSWGPPALAGGLALALVGIFGEGFLFRGWVYLVFGVVMCLFALRSLVLAGVREFYGRPRKQRAQTAVLPAGSLRAPKKS
jgi:hypothetical membrane protein